MDDSLEDVDKGADILSESADLTALPADTPTPPIEFDYNDGFDDGYSDDAAGSGGEIDEY